MWIVFKRPTYSIFIIENLKTYYKVRRSSDYDVLVYGKLTKKENQVQYDIFDKKIHEKMRESQVDGFTTFIFHSDHDDVLYDFQVKSFQDMENNSIFYE